MSEPPPSGEPAFAQALAAPRPHWTLPLVWIIPLVSALVGGWLAIDAYLERGPVATITFRTAEGLEAGKTKIRFKEVVIGEVESISLARDLSRVIVRARFSRQAAPLLVEDTRFWVVRPRVGLNQVSGLGTLIAGAYIGLDAGRSKTTRRAFEGLESPPVITADHVGRQFVLRAEEVGSLGVGDPVYYRRTRVGTVTALELEPSGEGVRVEVFVEAPHYRHVTAETRFWHASGIDVQVDAEGVQIRTESVLTLLAGGIAFQTPAGAARVKPAESGSAFALFPTRDRAMKFGHREEREYVVVFAQSVRGLASGAPVEFRGLPVGEVVSIGLDIDPAGQVARVPVTIRLFPAQLKSRGAGTKAGPAIDPDVLLEALVAKGLRAQLRPANLLTGQLLVALDYFPNAPRAKLDLAKTPRELPTVLGSFEDLQVKLGRVLERLDALPLEDIGADLRKSLAALERLLQTAEQAARRIEQEMKPESESTIAEVRRTLAGVRATLDEVRNGLGEARRTLRAADELLAPDSPLQYEAREALRELARAARELRALAESLEQNPDALLRGKRAVPVP